MAHGPSRRHLHAWARPHHDRSRRCAPERTHHAAGRGYLVRRAHRAAAGAHDLRARAIPEDRHPARARGPEGLQRRAVARGLAHRDDGDRRVAGRRRGALCDPPRRGAPLASGVDGQRDQGDCASVCGRSEEKCGGRLRCDRDPCRAWISSVAVLEPRVEQAHGRLWRQLRKSNQDRLGDRRRHASCYSGEHALFVRVSGTDWLEDSLPNEPSWRVEDTARLARILYEHGVDLIDISSGGISPKQKIGIPVPEYTKGQMRAYQAPFAKTAMKAVGADAPYSSSKIAPTSANKRPERILVAAVGCITSGKQAEELLHDGYADVIMVGRHFTKNPGAVWEFADELDVKIRVASQIGWGFAGRGKKVVTKESDGN